MRFCRLDATIHDMNALINKLQRKLGRYAVKNLSLILIICYMIGYVIRFSGIAVGGQSLLNYLTLNPYEILHGQVWRLVSWILIPPGESNLLFVLIMLYFYYSIGTALERTWGTFRYNLYIFSGMLFTIAAAFLMLAGMYLFRPTVMGIPFSDASAQGIMSFISRVSFSTYYVNMSIFLAFAATFPDAKVLLMFFIPVKIKWLGIVYALMLLYDMIVNPFFVKIAIVASLLNFILFFFGMVNWRRLKPSEIKRRNDFKKAVSGNYRRAPGNGNGSSAGTAGTGTAAGTGPSAERMRYTPAGTMHRCAICGRTEKDGADLEFRYCSKCEGSYEYCQDHLFTHVHVKKG